MSAIGLRVTPKQGVFWVILNGSPGKAEVVDKGKLTPPKAYQFPQQLAWLRERFLALIDEHQISACGIKEAEHGGGPKGRQPRQDPVRKNIEGVFIEACGSRDLSCSHGAWKTLGSGIGTRRAKAYSESGEFRGIEGLKDLQTNYREAAVAARAGLALIEEGDE